jgi:hypothetical protein
VAALLFRGKLVFPVNASRVGLDQGLHELVGVQRPAEAGLGVGDDRHQPVLNGLHALRELDLVRRPAVQASAEGSNTAVMWISLKCSEHS